MANPGVDFSKRAPSDSLYIQVVLWGACVHNQSITPCPRLISASGLLPPMLRCDTRRARMYRQPLGNYPSAHFDVSANRTCDLFVVSYVQARTGYPEVGQ